MKHWIYQAARETALFFFLVNSVFAGCQIPYPKREFLTEEEPDEKGDKVSIKYSRRCLPHGLGASAVQSALVLPLS